MLVSFECIVQGMLVSYCIRMSHFSTEDLIVFLLILFHYYTITIIIIDLIDIFLLLF